jgi:hypothetical protein
MKIRYPAIIFFLLTSVLAFAQQGRESVKIFIPLPNGGELAHRSYLQENFSMEALAAGYSVVDRAPDSDYTLTMNIKPNMVYYDDGTTEQAPPDEPQWTLDIILSFTADGAEIVQLGFLYTNIEEMNDYNLYLLYQIMANVPLTKDLGEFIPVIELEDDHWRNKWFYVFLSMDYNIPIYTPHVREIFFTHSEDQQGIVTANVQVDQVVTLGPGITFGGELQFLDWMSAEAALSFSVGRLEGLSHVNGLVGAFSTSVKFPFKPLKHFMIEPYIGAVFPLSLSGGNVPRIGLQGGFQVAVKLGSMGGLFFNIRG